MQVNVTKLVRRHLLSTSTVSIVDIVPQDLIETDDHPQLEILFKQNKGSKLLIQLRGGERLNIERDLPGSSQQAEAGNSCTFWIPLHKTVGCLFKQ
jgi:hypothetical protein